MLMEEPAIFPGVQTKLFAPLAVSIILSEVLKVKEEFEVVTETVGVLATCILTLAEFTQPLASVTVTE